MDAKASLSEDILNGLFSQGFLGVTVDAEYGGTQSSFAALCLVVEVHIRNIIPFRNVEY